MRWVKSSVILGAAKNLVTVLTTVLFAVSCWGSDPVGPTPAPPSPATVQDKTAPTITVSQGEVNVIAGLTVTVSGNQLKIGDTQAASWKDDKSGTCTLALTFTPGTAGASPKTINSWDKLTEAGKLTVKVTDEAGNSASSEIKLIVKATYTKLSVTDLKPVDILPVIGQITHGDKQVYDHIEHLRVAEATRIRDMMWEYGAGDHSSEAYRALMDRLNAGMTLETPKGYDNYEIIGELSSENPSEHARCEWSILDALLNHASLVVCHTPNGSAGAWFDSVLDYLDNRPNSIMILWNSTFFQTDKASYDIWMSWTSFDGLKLLCESKTIILFAAGTNVSNPSTWVVNKVFNEEYEGDEHGVYSLCSMANSNKNHKPNGHLMVTIATNKTGDIDQTGITQESSRFPVGFANNVLFSGRGFPEHTEGVIYGPSGRYTTSDTNYFNVALMSICFQMFAEVADVDELLDMVHSTALTDYIRLDLNGDGDTNDICDGHPESQPLQLINPAGFIRKYLMAAEIPGSIGAGETSPLGKGYYKGVVFNIPGAEVKIGEEWIPATDENAERIKASNPFDVEWRVSGDLLKKYGYTPGQTVDGRMLLVDDQWNGLRLEVPFSISFIP